ncbi:TPM domain-containing protein [Corynebacterium lujinxingii]|uniref:TPM domain-containing protein n=1 Tax=Corynebacterium lujinxingii TaxID=2763010 RepID=A0A7H0JXI4_9CORY|nr:TPM domain-containing protein [Corynebacterium lujinxingii]MBC3177809.1 TPM domain-containing protein [Corynebacterium lujinxingii]NNO09946.1 TPM domain-containing protein [Corynebacterium lujinxingii]QNP89750.1 TPM domain-containing protein [Corynebacterium lujinxingii]
MTSRYLRVLAVSGLLFAAGPAFGLADTPAVAQGVATAPTVEPGLLTQPVTDDANVLSPAERSEIEDAIKQVSQSQGKSVRVVFLRSFGDMTPSDWIDQAVAANGSNTAVLAISPDERAYNVGGGEEWSQDQIDRMNNAAYAQLTELNWSQAALNAVESVSGSSSSDGAGWLAGGLGAVALAGGGVYAATRKNSKKTRAKQIESAKALDPADTDSLGRLPTPTLEEVARDALVSADESITQGKEELQLATSEFGAERVRPFTSAMNEATTTLQRAFSTHQKLYDAIPETEPEKRAMLVDIISSSGQAEQALRDKTAEFNDMRGVLMRAPDEVDKVLARTVDIRARLEPAREQLERLRAEYPAEMLESIVDNVDLAAASLDEAEKALNDAREIASQPAGRQGALLDMLAAANHAVEVSDTNLNAIEHAEDNIRAAQTNLPSLIDEIRSELREIDQVKAARSQGARIDVDALDAVAAKAQRMLDSMGNRAETDPLALYADLTSMDTEIDEALDRAKGAAGNQARALQLFDQQMQVATAQIQRAEDVIRSRGRIIGSHARSLLAEAKRLYAQAHQLRVRDTRAAIDNARAATDTARRAEQAANDDIRRYQAARNRQTADSMARAVLWGTLLSGGGGFGGGGGGFGGGGGGGFSGGRPSNRGGTF